VPVALPHKLITVSRRTLTIVLRLSGAKLIIFYPAQSKSPGLIKGYPVFAALCWMRELFDARDVIYKSLTNYFKLQLTNFQNMLMSFKLIVSMPHK
jgi:hypothetical protein